MRDGWELEETGSGGPKTRDRGEGLRKKVEKKEDSRRRGANPVSSVGRSTRSL